MDIKRFLKKNASTICLVVGCAGVIGTAVSAVFGKEKYDDIIEEVKSEKNPDEDLKKSDVIKAGAKAYWLTAVIAVGSICCLVASHKISQNTLATVSTALAMKTADYKTLAKEAKEKLGEKKYAEMEGKIVEDKMNANPPVIVAGTGDTLFYDAFNGRYFFSNMETVRQGVNDAVKELRHTNSLSLNEFWNMITPDLEDIDGGEWGWDTCFDGGVDDICVSYYPKLVQDGPYKGKAAIAIKFDTGSEPACNIGRYR